MGHSAEAEFCQLVQNWNRAKGEVGLSVSERVMFHKKFKDWLMAGVSFSDFPSHGYHFKGIPTQLFEAIVAAIDGYLTFMVLFQRVPIISIL